MEVLRACCRRLPTSSASPRPAATAPQGAPCLRGLRGLRLAPGQGVEAPAALALWQRYTPAVPRGVLGAFGGRGGAGTARLWEPVVDLAIHHCKDGAVRTNAELGRAGEGGGVGTRAEG